MSSIREVAALAGVSPATVSRVMNATAKVDPEKQQRVLQAIEDTGFVPNEVARSLCNKSARLIGLIVPGVQNPFFTQLAELLGEAAEELGYRVFLCEARHGADSILHALTLLTSMNVDGVVLAVSNEEVEERLSQFQIPIVAVDCMESSPCVAASLYCDYYQGGRLAMEHLIECGCRKVVCIKSNQEIFSARKRYQGYRDVCREHGIPEYTVDCDYNFEAGISMTEELLENYPDADGILACNDIVAVSTFKILRKNHIEVPRQVKLVGFDDIYLARLISPELTTVHQPLRQMAQAAVRQLVGSCTEESREKTVIFPVSLMVRETTGEC